MTDNNSPRDVSVGYKRPPSHTRFRPGQSGNPKGKKKGLRNFATDARAMLKAKVSLTEKGSLASPNRFLCSTISTRTISGNF